MSREIADIKLARLQAYSLFIPNMNPEEDADSLDRRYIG